MIILGVDPGTLVTGYGVIEGTGRSIRVRTYDVVRNRGTSPLPERLKMIYQTLEDIINRYHPDEFAIETAFYGKNAQSALKIGHARGISILSAVLQDIPTTEYSPREVKKAVVGNGTASKEQVQFMVKTLLRMKETPKFFDATDALAVAICHYHRITAPRAKFSDWKTYVESHPERVVTQSIPRTRRSL
ncbi:MAG: crossover junction endodeoxyribonuclease RuvC [Bacteroidota bacterium]